MAAKRKTYVPQLIEEALLKLMSEKPFTDITITELVERAEVSRASFYRNFNTTKEVLDQFLDHFFIKLMDIAGPIIESSDAKSWRKFIFDYIYFMDNSESKYLQISSENTSIFLDGFIIRAKSIRNRMKTTSMNDEYFFTTRLFAINGAILTWKERERTENVEEVVNFLMNEFFPFSDKIPAS